jgi:hypothetical protein
MFILAQNDKTYARISFNVGPGGQVLIPVAVDYSGDFGATDKQAWDVEYQANIIPATWPAPVYSDTDQPQSIGDDFSSYALPHDFLSEFENMEPAERQLILDELAERPDLWDEEGEVMSL